MLISKHNGRIFRKREINPYEIWEDDKGKYVKMFTKDNIYFTFDYNDIDIVRKTDDKFITWGLHENKKVFNKDRTVYYVITKINNKTRYLHQHIMNYFGKGSNELTIDHIDRDPLNNRRYNLRLATKTEQNKNTMKRIRKLSAQQLPNELKDIILPKYVYYMKCKEPRTKLGYCEKFIIQCHPKQTKNQIVSSSSSKVSLDDKLKQILKKLEELDNL